jgi:hypothetical protein
MHYFVDYFKEAYICANVKLIVRMGGTEIMWQFWQQRFKEAFGTFHWGFNPEKAPLFSAKSSSGNRIAQITIKLTIIAYYPPSAISFPSPLEAELDKTGRAADNLSNRRPLRPGRNHPVAPGVA